MILAGTMTYINALLSPVMICLFALLGLVAVVTALLRSPLVKGWVGEGIINLALKLFLDKRVYHLVKNVTLPCDDGTTQIDHVVVSRFGIFVIETKNMRGWIFGTDRDATWTQKFPHSSYKFPNPVRQNDKHIAVMAELLGLPVQAFQSVVMFVGDGKLKTKVPPNVMTGKLVTFIKSHRSVMLTDEQVREAMEAIARQRLAPGLGTHLKHVRNVRAIVNSKKGRGKA
jgi:hypothetical protein